MRFLPNRPDHLSASMEYFMAPTGMGLRPRTIEDEILEEEDEDDEDEEDEF